MSSITAIYENGVLRPTRKLSLREGETVEIEVIPKPAECAIDEKAILERMRSAQSITELFEAYEMLPPPTDGYDLCKALNENRKATGERLPYPELEANGQ